MAGFLRIEPEYLHDAVRLGARQPVEGNRQRVTWLDTLSRCTTALTAGQRPKLLGFDFGPQFYSFDIRIALPTLCALSAQRLRETN